MRMEDPHLQRALLLAQQGRHELAEQELRHALAGNPNQAMTHSLLALCLVKRKAFQEATDEAQQAIHLAPDVPFSHHALAVVWYERNRLREAEAAVGEAIALNPFQAESFGLLAAIKFGQRQWQVALDAAEQGLAADPEHVQCINYRAMALNKLGRASGAAEALEAALARNPEDDDSHANLGWTRLQQGRTKEALEHFREALRLNPESGSARAGIVEALKSRNPIYRILLAYFLWISRLSQGAQWGVILGAYFGFQLLKGISQSSPDLAVWIQPLLWLYIAFVVLTWIGVPVFNLLLRLNRYGRYALSQDQVTASNWVGASLLLAILLLAAGLILGNFGLLVAALIFGLLVLPIAATFQLHAGWPRNMMALYTVGLLLCAVLGGITASLPSLLGGRSDGISGAAFMLFAIGIFLSQFVANSLAHWRPKY
jgi:tetratricopeptide (TPR) repeat protein